MAIITAAELQAYLDQTGASDLTLLSTIATRASDIVEKACLPLVFAAYPGASQKVVYSDGTSILYLPPFQAGSVTAVRYGDATTTPVTATSYRVDGSALYLVAGFGYLPGRHPQWSPGPYYITAVWGYGAVPESIKEVAIEVGINIWRGKDKGMFTEVVGVEGAGAVVLSHVGGLNATQLAVVNSVKRAYAGPPVV